jgi:hypothetical protein
MENVHPVVFNGTKPGTRPEGMRVTQPFEFAQGREPVERQMGVLRQPQKERKTHLGLCQEKMRCDDRSMRRVLATAKGQRTTCGHVRLGPRCGLQCGRNKSHPEG